MIPDSVADHLERPVTEKEAARRMDMLVDLATSIGESIPELHTIGALNYNSDLFCC